MQKTKITSICVIAGLLLAVGGIGNIDAAEDMQQTLAAMSVLKDYAISCIGIIILAAGAWLSNR